MGTVQPASKAKPAMKPAPQVVQLSPELETFAVVKLGRPKSLWRWLNRVITWANGEISRDEWDLAYEEARRFVDGRTMHPEDAARRVENMIVAQLDCGKQVHAAVAKCEATDQAVLIAFFGRPQDGFFHSRMVRLVDPRGTKRG